MAILTAVFGQTAASRENLRTLCLAAFDIANDPVRRAFVHDRTDVGFSSLRIADHEIANPFCETRRELGGDPAIDDGAAGCRALLASAPHRASEQVRPRVIEVGICQHDRWIFPAELELKFD